ncbi:MAG: hypothetical protein AAGL11_02865 [Pseudomonadota bacterium]
MLRATVIALTTFGVLATPAFANGLKAEQVVEVATVSVDESGNEVRTYALAEEVAPGDEVRYSLAYVNEGAQPAEAVSLVMPVPAEMTYVETSADGTSSTITYSVDGGTSFYARDSLVVTSAEGARLAASDEITHIKWAFAEPIPAASTGQISFRAVLK